MMDIALVMQPNPAACGQACVAMLAGVPVQEAIRVMKTAGPTSIGQIIDALDFFGIAHAAKNVRVSKQNPVPAPTSVLTVHMPGYTHWVLLHDGRYYDPEFGLLDACHPDGKVTSFLAIGAGA